MKARIAEIINKIKSRSITQILLFLTIVAACLGEVINVFGFKLSWIFAGLTAISFVIENIKNRFKLPLGTLDLKIVFGFFVFWLTYATVQMMLIDRNVNAVTFYKFLAVNIFLVLMIILNTRSSDNVLYFSKALITGYFINLLFVVWELYTGKQIVNALVNPSFVYGVFANMNDLCTVVAYGIFALILNMLITRKNIIISAAAIIFSVYIIFLDKSRASLLSLIALVLFWGFFELALILYRRSHKCFNWLICIVILLPIICAVVILSIYTPEQLIDMVSTDTNALSDNERLGLTRGAISIIRSSPLFGVGPGQSVQILGINVHSFFLEIICEYGLLIFSGIAYIFVTIFMAYKTKLSHWVSSLLMAFVPFFAIVSISSSSAAKIKATWVIITVVFLTVVYAGREKGKHE